MKKSLKDYRLLQPKKSIIELQKPHPVFLTEITVNPYVGCSYGCAICYSIDDKEISHPYSTKIGVKTNIVSQLKQKLTEIGQSPPPNPSIALGNLVEPYQPVEVDLQLSRSCLEVIKEFKFPVQIFTKSDLILRDLKLLAEHSQENLSAVNVTLSTMNENLKEVFEPYSPAIDLRLKLISKLAEEGIPVGILFAPVMPYINDTAEEIEEILKAVKKSGANYFIPIALSLHKDVVRSRVLSLINKYFNQFLHQYEALYENSPFPSDSYSKRLSDTIAELAKKYNIPLQVPVANSNPITDIRVEPI
ncbi:MAG: radical SAM protein [Elusimicrobiota bacterium]|nr:radical SAM protein [Elusimicrobiota bacterium]